MKESTFYNKAFRVLVEWIGHFLPLAIRERPIEYQFKARLAVITLMQGVVIGVGYFLAHTLFNGRMQFHALLALLFSLLFGICLIFIKKGAQFERVLGLLFMLLIVWNGLYSTLINPHVLLYEGMLFPMFVLYGSLICGRTWALRVGVAAGIGTIAMYAAAKHHGFYPLSSSNVQEYLESTKGILITINSTMLIFGTLFSLLRRVAKVELHKETDWMLRGSKLREISSYATGLGHQMAVPLEDLRWDLKHLQRRVEGPDVELQRISAMEQSVARMVTLSRSMDWVYRNDQGPYSIQASDILKQMELILGAKAAAHAWMLRTRCEDDSLVIHGAIPAMVLLIVTLAHRICESQIPPTYEAPLRLEVGRNEDQIYWRLTWAEEAQVNLRDREKGELLAMAEEVRGSLIQELLRNCKATLRSFVRNGQNQLVVASRIWGGNSAT